MLMLLVLYFLQLKVVLKCPLICASDWNSPATLLAVAEFTEDDIEQLEKRWDKIRSHGIVVRQPLPRDWVTRLTKLAPVVYMTPQDIHDNVDAVVSHEARTTTQILNHLRDHGHEHIAWIGIKDTNRQDVKYSHYMDGESLFHQRIASTHASTLAAWWMLMGLDELPCPDNMIILTATRS